MQLALLGALLSLVIFLGSAQLVLACQGSGCPEPIETAQILTGFAWAPNIGWISFDNNGLPGPTYGVTMAALDNPPNDYDQLRYLSGYAWNPNIGWIKFDPNLTGPDGTGTGAAFVIISGPPGVVEGWARACAVFQSNCTGDLKPDSELGGWDGWIGMSQVTVDDNRAPTRFGSNDPASSSFAWGGKVIGWISFCDPDYINGGERYCVLFGELSVSCQVSPSPVNGVTNVSASPHTATWTMTVRSGSLPEAPYTYEWTDGAFGGALFNPDSYSGYPAPLPPGFAGPDVYSFSTTKDYSSDCENLGPSETFTQPEPAMAIVNDKIDSGWFGAWACPIDTTIFCDHSPVLPTGGNLTAPKVGTITITSQPLASLAISSGIELINTSLADNDNANVSIQSSDSVLDSAISLGGTKVLSDKVKCRLSTSPLPKPPVVSEFGSCDSSNIGEVPPGGTLYFNILVKDLAPPALNQYNPYKIILENSSHLPASQIIPVSFDYAVGTVN